MIKKIFQTLLHPTNRALRLTVGLMLVALLVVHVGQTMATRDVPESQVTWSPLSPKEYLKKAEAAPKTQATRNLETIDPTPVAVQVVTTPKESLTKKIFRLAKEDHIALLELCKSLNAERINSSYTCTFVKQERIRGKLGAEQQMTAKFRANPFSVAMLWTKNKPIGDAILYVDGKFKNDDGKSQMLVRPESTLFQKLTGGHVMRLPDGDDVMRNTLRPVTQFGLANSLQSLIDVYVQATKQGECRIDVAEKLAKVDGRDCVVLIRYLPKNDKLNYPAKKTLIFIDLKYALPVRVMGWNWKDKLSCNYEFHDIDFSKTLSDSDFVPSANGIAGAE